MSRIKNYLYHADNDYMFVKNTIDYCGDNYNTPAYILSQAAEKYMKAVIGRISGDTELITDLGSMLRFVDSYKSLPVSSEDQEWLVRAQSATTPSMEPYDVSLTDLKHSILVIERLRDYSKETIMGIDVDTQVVVKKSNQEYDNIKRDMQVYAINHGIPFDDLCIVVCCTMSELLRTGYLERDAVSHWKNWLDGRYY